MPDTTLNPDTLAEHQFRPGFERCTCGQKIPTTLHSKYYVDFPDYQAMARHQMEALAVALPEVTRVEELVTTRAGLALANTAFGEGLSAGIRACNASGPDRPFKKPVSPYSAPLLAMIKADSPEVKP